MQKVIVHADDFGGTEEITRGIVIGMESGAVTNTSVMANMPGTENALPIASSWSGNHSFGVHLNFCEGRALSGASTLTCPDGALLPKRQLLIRALLGQLKTKDVCDEIRDQIDRVGSSGVSISHIDSHKHLQQLPVVRFAVATVLSEYGIERIRVTREASLWRRGQKFPDGVPRVVRLLMAAGAAKHFMTAGLRSPDKFLDIADVKNGTPNLSKSLGRNDRKSIVEIGCHFYLSNSHLIDTA